MKNLIIFLFAGLLFCGCKEYDASADTEVGYQEMKLSAQAKSEHVEYDAESNYEMAADSTAAPAAEIPLPPEKIEQKIIKLGELRFGVSDMDATYTSIQQLVKKYKVIVQNDSEGKDEYSLSRTMLLRVPNEYFDDFINELSKGVDYFDRKTISVDDVTEEYIDVASRIKTKKALEERYLQLLSKANKVSEMLEIERELANIREEIEAKEGRLKYIQNKVSMSTISIQFYKPTERKAGATVSFGTKFANAIKSGFNGISTFFLWLIEVWPFIIILVALIFFIRRRFKKKRNNTNVDTN